MGLGTILVNFLELGFLTKSDWWTTTTRGSTNAKSVSKLNCPLLIFIGIGAMIDFSPLKPIRIYYLSCGSCSVFSCSRCLAVLFQFDIRGN